MRYIALCLLLIVSLAFVSPYHVQQKKAGAWVAREGSVTHLLLVSDNYLSLTAYDQEGRKFLYTLGGPVQVNKDQWLVTCEYDSKDSARVGVQMSLPLVASQEGLTAGKFFLYPNTALPLTWNLLDKGNAALAGNWQITQRMQEGKLQDIHQTGTRKTVKLLTGTMFQWIAIDPGVKGFYGTGGGAYTFKDGKYTEQISFFSRDSSRVGASLSFTGKLENGKWHHSGKSSRGDNIFEVWSRK